MQSRILEPDGRSMRQCPEQMHLLDIARSSKVGSSGESLDIIESAGVPATYYGFEGKAV